MSRPGSVETSGPWRASEPQIPRAIDVGPFVAGGQSERGATRDHDQGGRMRRTTGVLIATAAASLILSGAVVARAAEEKTGDTVHCSGINACKGQGACAGAGHSC